jgi:hypothetical protein
LGKLFQVFFPPGREISSKAPRTLTNLRAAQIPGLYFLEDIRVNNGWSKPVF